MHLALAHSSLRIWNKVNYIAQQLAIQVIELLLEFNKVCKLALS